MSRVELAAVREAVPCRKRARRSESQMEIEITMYLIRFKSGETKGYVVVVEQSSVVEDVIV